MSKKTMLHFQRGTKLDALNNFAAIKVEITEATTAATLRKELQGEMLKSDRFLNAHGFPLPNSTDAETNTLLKDLVPVTVVPPLKNSSEKSDLPPVQPEGLDVKEPLKTLNSEDDQHNSSPPPSESSDSSQIEGKSPVDEIKVIRILAKEENTREALKLGDWPKDPGFWASDIMNDAVLPPKSAPEIAAPEGAADLSAFLDVNSFGIVQWAELIKSNNLLKGVRMGNNGPRPSAFALVDGPPDLKHFYTFRHPNAYIDIQTVTSEHTSKFITQGWHTGSLSVGIPFFSIGAEASKHQMDASQTVHKTIFTTASYKYAFVTIVFDPMTLKTTSEFNSAVAEALKKNDDDAKRAALRKLFDRYGHAFQTEVMLGAMLSTTDSITTDANMTQSKFENSIKTKLSTAIPTYGIEIGPSYGTGKQEEHIEKDVNQEERKIITAKGGNPLLSTALTKWIPSIADYRTWRVIEVSGAVPMTEFIRVASQKREVESLANADPDAYTKPLRGRWVEVVEHMTSAEGDEKSRFRTYRPIVHDGWYWLGQSLDKRWALEVQEIGSKGDALGAVHDVSLIHTYSGSDSEAKVCESFWKIHPVNSDDYVVLGDQFLSGPTTSPMGRLNLTTPELSSLRAVRKDLCVRATISKEPYWSNDASKDTKYVTVYEPVKDGSEPVLKHFLFRAFDYAPSQKEAVLDGKVTVYMLKASSIFVENWI